MWTDELIPMVRYTINDIEGTLYTDARLQKAIAISARYVNLEAFNNTYLIDVSGSGTITPDPTDPRDEWFLNLVNLKTACLLGQAESKTSAGQGIVVKDGDSLLDLKGISQYKALQAKGYCDAYEQAKYAYLMGGGINGGTGHQAIIGPFDYINWR